MQCSSCGMQNDGGARFCQRCGCGLVQAAVADPGFGYAPPGNPVAGAAPGYGYAPVGNQVAAQAAALPYANSGYGPPPPPPAMRGMGPSGAMGGTALARTSPTGNSPGLAAVLSLFIVGLGQLYNNDFKKGAVMFCLALLGGVFTLGILWFAVAIWSAVDAHQVAKGTGRAW